MPTPTLRAVRVLCARYTEIIQAGPSAKQKLTALKQFLADHPDRTLDLTDVEDPDAIRAALERL